jgi:uncharacterized membrane protein YeaQ/YmgE (transglycosylase-associated protein family)
MRARGTCDALRSVEESSMEATVIITWILIGLLAGVLASLVVGWGYGLLGDIVIGIVGAFLGGWLFDAMHWHAPFAGLPGTVFVAFCGAVVLLVVLRLLHGGSGRHRA